MLSALRLALLAIAFAYAHTACALVPMPHNASQLGTVQLPHWEADNVPPACTDFQAICKLEALRTYDQAFAEYEARYATCGDWGWSTQGGGAGLDAYVFFKTTPCGLRVAVKGSREVGAQHRNAKSCHILRELTEAHHREGGPQRFPTFYHYSNATSVCYSELVYPTVSFKPYFVKLLTQNSLDHLKLIFLQGLEAIAAMRCIGIQHGDFTIRNLMLRRLAEEDHAEVELMVIDFGAAYPLHGMRDHDRDMYEFTRSAGNQGYSDVYTLACSLYKHAYPSEGWCFNDLGDVPESATPGTLRHVLQQVAITSIANEGTRLISAMHPADPDFETFKNLIRGALSI